MEAHHLNDRPAIHPHVLHNASNKSKLKTERTPTKLGKVFLQIKRYGIHTGRGPRGARFVVIPAAPPAPAPPGFPRGLSSVRGLLWLDLISF